MPEHAQQSIVPDRIRVGIAADHGGFVLKAELIATLRAAGYKIEDYGAFELTPDDDYPDFIIPLARAVATGRIGRAVALCDDERGQLSSRLRFQMAAIGAESRVVARTCEFLDWQQNRVVLRRADSCQREMSNDLTSSSDLPRGTMASLLLGVFTISIGFGIVLPLLPYLERLQGAGV